MTSIDWSRLRKLLSPRSVGAAVWHFLAIVVEFPRDLPRLGIVSSYRLLRADLEHWLRRIFQRHCLDNAPMKLVSLPIPGYSHRVYFRRNTSDLHIVRQVFRSRDYDCLHSEQEIRFFVDGGANIGATSFFLLSKYPHARAIVIEPDETNLEVCRRNLGPFNDRIQIMPLALWSMTAPLKFCRPENGKGQKSSISVVSSAKEEAEIEGVSLDDLFTRIDSPIVDLVKLDVEGAEEKIFGEGTLCWLERTRNLLIELHGAACEEVVLSKLKAFEYEISHSGDLSVFQNIRKKVSSGSK